MCVDGCVYVCVGGWVGADVCGCMCEKCLYLYVKFLTKKLDGFIK